MSESKVSEQPFQLGAFKVEPSHDLICLRSKKHKVEPKVMQVLLYLINNSDHIVSVDELLANIWKGTVVTPQTAQRCISILRKIFKSAEDGEIYIQTYTKKGYQFTIEPKLTLIDQPTKYVRSLLFGCAILCVLLVLTSLWWRSQTEPALEPVLAQHSQVKNYALHPTDSAIAFIVRHPDSTETSLWISHLGIETNLAPLGLTSPELQLNWAPNGQELVVMSRIKGVTLIELISLSADYAEITKKRLLLSDPTHDYRQVKFKDSQQLFMTRTPKEMVRYELVALDLSSGVVSSVLDEPHISIFDLQQGLLAYEQKDHFQYRIKVIDVASGELITSHTQPTSIEDLEWLPDGSGVLVSLHQEGIHRLDLQGTFTKIGSPTMNWFEDLELSSSGQLFFIQRNNRKLIESSQAATCCAAEILEQAENYYDGSWGPDGRQFVYISELSGLPQIWLNTDQKQTQLTHFNSFKKITDLSWSLNGQWLLFKADQAIYTYSFLIGSSQKLVMQELFVEPLTFSADGQAFFYLDRNGPDDTIWHQSLSSAKRHAIQLEKGSQVVAYGGKVYYMTLASHELYEYDGNKSRLLSAELPDDTKLHSANQHEIFYFIDRQNQRKTIWGYDVNTGQNKIVAPRLSYRGFITSISKDYQVLYNEQRATTRQLFQLPLQALLIDKE